MPDPHGWNAQNQQIRINQQRGAQRYEAQTAAGAARFNQRQGEQEPQARGPERDPPVPHAAYWAVVAYCVEHNKWGCSFKVRNSKDAYYAAFSAACDSPIQWCLGVKWIHETAGWMFSPGYLMVRRNRAGKFGWDTGRHLRGIERELRRRIGRDSELLLLVSVRRGVLVNNGLDLQVGRGRDRPGVRM